MLITNVCFVPEKESGAVFRKDAAKSGHVGGIPHGEHFLKQIPLGESYNPPWWIHFGTRRNQHLPPPPQQLQSLVHLFKTKQYMVTKKQFLGGVECWTPLFFRWPPHGCCWETFHMFVSCGLVGNPHLAATIQFVVPFQRQPSPIWSNARQKKPRKNASARRLRWTRWLCWKTSGTKAPRST